MLLQETRMQCNLKSMFIPEPKLNGSLLSGVFLFAFMKSSIMKFLYLSLNARVQDCLFFLNM